MAITEIYVDPSQGGGGAGTIGNPYGDLEAAIVAETFDTTNGTRINIKAGVDHVLTAELETSLADTVSTPAWNPTATAPLVFQGYTTAAGDGGQGGISGGGLVGIISTARDYISFIDLHLHNCGSNNIIVGDDQSAVINCELDNSTASAIAIDENGIVVGNYIHNIGTNGVVGCLNNSYIAFNYFENGTNNFDYCIINCAGTALRNICNIDGASNGIEGTNLTVINNSIFSNGGTGTGVEVRNNLRFNVVSNNLVEGFSGTGGIGFDFSTGTGQARVFGGNSVYNNATNFVASTQADPIYDFATDNEVLTASPFTDAASGDFSPVDTGSVKEGSVPAAVGNV